MPSAPSDDPFAALFASDLATQVRESFAEMIDFGASVSAATQETIARFQGALKDERDGPVIIIALAALQVREREIFASIRNAALELLQDDAVEKLISRESAARNQVRAVLDELQETLEAIEVEDDEDDDETDEDDEEEDDGWEPV